MENSTSRCLTSQPRRSQRLKMVNIEQIEERAGEKMQIEQTVRNEALNTASSLSTTEAIQALQSQLKTTNEQVVFLMEELTKEREFRQQIELEWSQERREATEALKRLEQLLQKERSKNDQQQQQKHQQQLKQQQQQQEKQLKQQQQLEQQQQQKQQLQHTVRLETNLQQAKSQLQQPLQRLTEQQNIPNGEWIEVVKVGNRKNKSVAVNNVPGTLTEAPSPPPRKKRIRNRTRPDVIRIEPAPGTNYTDMYRAVRGNPNLAPMIKLGHRTPKDHLSIILNKGVDGPATKAAIEALAPVGCRISLLVETETVIIRGLDMLATEEEVVSAISAKYETNVEVGAVRLHRFGNGNQRASVKVPRKLAAVMEGKLPVGYSIGRVTRSGPLKLEDTRCFRCMEKGHMSRTCKGPDRSKLCVNCGKPGHFVKECREVAKCLKCGGPHRIGSAHCGTRPSCSK